MPALGAAGWLYYKDYAALSRYHIDIVDDSLYISVPPEEEIEVPLQSIELMEIKGIDYGKGIRNPNPMAGTSYFTDLPDWHEMTLTLTTKEHYFVDLSRLSVEQRQILWRAIARRAGLVERK